MLSVAERNCFDDVHIEISFDSELLENADVPCASMTKAVIISDEKLSHSKASPQNFVNELFCSV